MAQNNSINTFEEEFPADSWGQAGSQQKSELGEQGFDQEPAGLGEDFNSKIEEIQLGEVLIAYGISEQVADALISGDTYGQLKDESEIEGLDNPEFYTISAGKNLIAISKDTQGWKELALSGPSNSEVVIIESGSDAIVEIEAYLKSTKNKFDIFTLITPESSSGEGGKNDASLKTIKENVGSGGIWSIWFSDQATVLTFSGNQKENKSDAASYLPEKLEIENSVEFKDDWDAADPKIADQVKLKTDIKLQNQDVLEKAIKTINADLAEAAKSGYLGETIKSVFTGTSLSPEDLNKATEGIKEMVLSEGLAISLEVVDGQVLNGQNAAYSDDSGKGIKTIYLNKELLTIGSNADFIASLILEEVGHSFDYIINGEVDTKGDEGEIFATIFEDGLKTVIDSAVLSEDDAGVILVGGKEINVEFNSSEFISLVFQEGYIGTIGSNTQQNNGAKSFEDLGIAYIIFKQLDNVETGVAGEFESAEGNDVPGTAVIVTTEGEKYEISGSIVWNEKSHDDPKYVKSYGFISNSGEDVSIDSSANGGDGFTFSPGSLSGADSNISLIPVALGTDPYSSGYSSEGIDIQGSADSKIVDELNDSLDESIQLSSLSIDSTGKVEGDNLLFTATLEGPLSGSSSYIYEISGTLNGSDIDLAEAVFTAYDEDQNIVTNGINYDSAGGTISLAPPTASFTVNYTTIDDWIVEGAETLNLTIGNISTSVSFQDNDFLDASETTSTNEDTTLSGDLLANASSESTGDGDLVIESFSIAGESGPFTLGSAYTIAGDSGGFSLGSSYSSPGVSGPLSLGSSYSSPSESGSVSLDSSYSSIGKGDLTINSDGTYSFVPANNNNGIVPVIAYTVSDGEGPTQDSTLSITVIAVNDPPSITGDLAATVTEGGSYTITTSDLNFSDLDDEAAGVTFSVSSLTNGTVFVNGIPATSFTGTQLAAGQVAFQHDGSDTTAASFLVNVEDGNEDSSTPSNSTINFTVTPVDDAAPEITSADKGNLAENATEGDIVYIATYKENDDIDNDNDAIWTLEAEDSIKTLFKIDKNTGIVEINEGASLIPGKQTYEFTIKLTDDAGNTSSEEVSINILKGINTPSAADDKIEVESTSGTSQLVNLLTNQYGFDNELDVEGAKVVTVEAGNKLYALKDYDKIVDETSIYNSFIKLQGEGKSIIYIKESGELIYQKNNPGEDYEVESFSYTIMKDGLTSNSAKVTVSIDDNDDSEAALESLLSKLSFEGDTGFKVDSDGTKKAVTVIAWKTKELWKDHLCLCQWT